MKITIDEFNDKRQCLFQTAPVDDWPLEETIAELRSASEQRPTVASKLNTARHLLIQPRSGVSDHAGMLTLLGQLQHADIGSITIDAYTRLNLWEKARTETRLNGYPLVTRGVLLGRELLASVPIPLEVRHGSPNGCLLAETAFACGITSFEGGGISYNLPYCKDVALKRSLSDWQYVDRLTGLLTEASGVLIDREGFGTLTAVLVPPSTSIAISILEMLLAVEQGVRCVTISYPESGNLVQDVSALRVIPRLAKTHADQVAPGTNPTIFTAMHQWMGVFPTNQSQAHKLISYGVLAGIAGRATKLINKTTEEALGLPTAQANATAIAYCQELVAYFAEHADAIDELCNQIDAAVNIEQSLIEREVNEILSAVYSLGTDDLVSSITRAFQLGILDIPFPASRHARGAVLPARDSDGAIRYLNYGGLSVSPATRRLNHDRLREKVNFSYAAILKDVYYMSAGNSLQANCGRRILMDKFEESSWRRS